MWKNIFSKKENRERAFEPANTEGDREWIGGRAQLPMAVKEPKPYPIDIALWYDTKVRRITGIKRLESDLSPDAVVDTLATAIANSELDPLGHPRRVRTEDPVLADAIRDRFGREMRVDVAPTPELSEILETISRQLEQPEVPSYLEGGRVAPETVERFFKVATKLYRNAPWKYLGRSEVLCVNAPYRKTDKACLSIMGHAGDTKGITLFDSITDYERFVETSARFIAGEDKTAERRPPVFTVAFETKKNIPKPMQKEVKRYKWKVPNHSAYPVIYRLDSDHERVPLSKDDVVFATALSEAVADFVTLFGDQIDDGLADFISMAFPYKDLAGRPSIDITAPHPEAPWFDDIDDLEEDEDEYENDEDAYEDDQDIEEEQTRSRTIVEAFLEARIKQGRDEIWINNAGFVIDSLYRFKIEYFDGVADGWMDDIVEEFMLDYFPRKVTVEKETIGKTPEILVSFFDWMGTTRKIKPHVVTEIRKRIISIRKEFMREADNPANFGMAKSIVTAMLEAGVDPTDENEAERFMYEYNERMLDEKPTHLISRSSSSRPTTDSPSSERRTRVPRTRWVWSGEGDAPDPKAACPCGSGKRYKKCCMPR